MNSFDSSTSEEVGPTVFQTGVWVRVFFSTSLLAYPTILRCVTWIHHVTVSVTAMLHLSSTYILCHNSHARPAVEV